MPLKRIGVFGGSFNPPHNGHLSLAKSAIRQLKLNKLLILPSGNPPHKELPEGTPKNEERYLLCQTAFSGVKKAEVLDQEMKEGGTRYTYETLEYLCSHFQANEWYLIVGTDMFLTLHQWRNPEVIFRLSHIAVLAREEDLTEEIQTQKKNLEENYGAKVTVLSEEPIVISSTEIRQQLRNQIRPKELSGKVYNQIRHLGLYGCFPMTLKQLRSEVRSRVDAKRYRHILGVEETAAKMAEMYGESVRKTRIAALLHDVTKCLKDADQLHLCEQYGIILDAVEQKNPKLLHAKTGAVVAREEFKASREICEAVAWHTTGKPEMTLLEKIIYLADYIEPGRKFEEVHELRELAFKDLDLALLTGMKHSISYVKGRAGCANVSTYTQKAIDYYEEKLQAGKENA